MDHHGAVKKIAEFMGYDLKEEVIDVIVEKSTFHNMKENPTWIEDAKKIEKPDAPGFFRNGVFGDWKNHFTPEQNAEFDAVYAEKMKGSELDLIIFLLAL